MAVCCVSPECPDASGFEHHGEWEVHGILQPALDEGSKNVAVSYQDDIAGLFSVHVRGVDGLDLFDEMVESGTYLLRCSGLPGVSRYLARCTGSFR
jgi:hypothetical protein